MTAPVRLEQIKNKERQEGARATRRHLFERCRAAADQMGDDIAGFALVVWDQEGYLRSAYEAIRGPIRAPPVPTLAADALNRHLAVAIAEEQRKENSD
jgi:hypothetical protein